mgnify:FL=1
MGEELGGGLSPVVKCVRVGFFVSEKSRPSAFIECVTQQGVRISGEHCTDSSTEISF